MKTIYGLPPYFKKEGPLECDDETADKLIEMGRASEEKPKSLPWKDKSITPDKETKVDPPAPNTKEHPDSTKKGAAKKK